MKSPLSLDQKLLLENGQLASLSNDQDEPFYVFSIQKAIENYRKINEALLASKPTTLKSTVYYAMKSFPEPLLLRALKKEGAQIDASTLQEIDTAIAEGFEPSEIRYTPIVKKMVNLKPIALTGVTINVHSFNLLEQVGAFAPRAISLRFLPKLPVQYENMGDAIFGFSSEEIKLAIEQAKKLGLSINGIHLHLGAMVFNHGTAIFLDCLRQSFRVIKQFDQPVTLNLGGGFGGTNARVLDDFPLKQLFSSIFEMIKAEKIELESIAIEPGRFISWNAGALICKPTSVNFLNNKNHIQLNLDDNQFNHRFLSSTGAKVERINGSTSEEKVECEFFGKNGLIFKQSISSIVTAESLAIYPAGCYSAFPFGEYEPAVTYPVVVI